jgi:hypothetical protein
MRSPVDVNLFVECPLHLLPCLDTRCLFFFLNCGLAHLVSRSSEPKQFSTFIGKENFKPFLDLKELLDVHLLCTASGFWRPVPPCGNPSAKFTVSNFS